MSRQELDTILSHTSSAQAKLLQDGVVDPSEYESSVLAAVRCMRGKGLIVSDPVRDVRGNLSFDPASAPGQGKDEFVAAVDSCRRDNLSDVEQFWNREHKPSEADLQAARDALAGCLAESHVSISPHPTSAELLAIAQSGNPAFGPCASKVDTQFGLPGFGG